MTTAHSTQVRLLHISDLHIKGPGWLRRQGLGHDPAIVSALARFVYAHRDEYDAILVTGDLSDWGHPDDLKAAHDFLFSPVGRSRTGESLQWLTQGGAPTLQGKRPDCPIYFMPGNHDRYVSQLGDPGGCQFEVTFGSDWDFGLGNVPRTPVRERVRSIYVPTARTDHQLAIICADCSLRTYADAAPYGRKQILGQGLANQDVLDRLKEETHKARTSNGEGCLVVWAIHYPPADVGLDLQLNGYSEVLKLAQDKSISVDLILSGHIHSSSPPFQPSAPLPPYVWCSGGTTSRQLPGISLTRTDHTAHIVEFSFVHNGSSTDVHVERRNFTFQPVNIAAPIESRWSIGSSGVLGNGIVVSLP